MSDTARPFIYDPPTEPLRVVHVDADLLVADKPSGLLTVPGKAAEHGDCLEARVQAAYPGAAIVHRLDMDTSGLVVMARTRAAHRHLGQQFEKRRVAKTYIARVWGALSAEAGTVEAPILCDWPNRPKQMVDFARGRAALTDWRVLQREVLPGGASVSRVEMFPRTGRSHQLRVHMLSLGHPILGDNFYAHSQAFEAAPRLQLHAERLGFRHPKGGEVCAFVSPCPF
ncbi:MAG: pseudouridine synthase [Pseudomonadota bacterium]